MSTCRSLSTIAIVSALLVLLIGVGSFFSRQFELHFDERVPRLSLIDWTALAAATSIFSALGLPRQVIALVYGHALGGAGGALLASSIAVAGCSLDFLAGRYWLRPWLTCRFPNKLLQLDHLLYESAFLKALALRLFPSGSNLLSSLLGGASAVSPAPFIAGSAVGYLPQMFLFAYIGSGANWAMQQRNSFIFVFFAITLALALIIVFQHRAKRHL